MRHTASLTKRPTRPAAPVGSCTLTTPVFCTMLRCVIRRIPAGLTAAPAGPRGFQIHISDAPILLCYTGCGIFTRRRGLFVMGEQAGQSRRVKRICAGILAHVDSGKTTLAEAMLYRAGALRRLGRVDHRDAFLGHRRAGTRARASRSLPSRRCWRCPPRRAGRGGDGVHAAGHAPGMSIFRRSRAHAAGA